MTNISILFLADSMVCIAVGVNDKQTGETINLNKYLSTLSEYKILGYQMEIAYHIWMV